MTVTHDMTHRFSTAHGSHSQPVALEDRFEVLKDIGDGSFGSVALARVRTAGASVARRGTVVSRLRPPALWLGMIANLDPHAQPDSDKNHEKDIRVIRTLS